MASVTFVKATRRYPGADHPAVDALDLAVGDGEFLVLVGPSGCGKSTSLRMLAGLDDVDEGAIYIGDDDVTSVSSKDRDIAMVFQNYALYPHMTVAQNMSFSLTIAKAPKPEIKRRVAEAAALLDLTDYLDRKPMALSGGQRQRVAMGRAIVREPRVFLMDEPLSNLDAKLRVQTRTQIAALQRRLQTTTVYVTHDQVEAMTMGDRVAIMKAGILQQVDTPGVLYSHPANTFVAGFVGSPAMNLVAFPADGDRVLFGDQELRLDRDQKQRFGDASTVTVGARPEHLRVVGEGEPGLVVTVGIVEELGADAYAYCQIDGGQPGAPAGVDLVVRTVGRGAPPAGSRARVAVDPAEVMFFGADGTNLTPAPEPAPTGTR